MAERLPEQCNDPLHPIERIGRNITKPKSFSHGKLRLQMFYPYRKEDDYRKGLYTNKISVVRLCRCLTEDKTTIDFDTHSNIAQSFLREGNEFKGYLILSLQEIMEIAGDKIEFEVASSARNPFHCHLIIKDYNQPFTPEKKSYSQLLTQAQRSILDTLQDKAYTLYLPSDTPYCTLCSSPRA